MLTRDFKLRRATREIGEVIVVENLGVNRFILLIYVIYVSANIRQN